MIYVQCCHFCVAQACCTPGTRRIVHFARSLRSPWPLCGCNELYGLYSIGNDRPTHRFQYTKPLRTYIHAAVMPAVAVTSARARAVSMMPLAIRPRGRQPRTRDTAAASARRLPCRLRSAERRERLQLKAKAACAPRRLGCVLCAKLLGTRSPRSVRLLRRSIDGRTRHGVLSAAIHRLLAADEPLARAGTHRIHRARACAMNLLLHQVSVPRVQHAVSGVDVPRPW